MSRPRTRRGGPPSSRRGSIPRSRSGRSTGRPRRSARPRSAVDVYLLPAVVGGGLGDIEETLAAGRWLAHAGFRLRLYRRPDRPLPRSVEGPWAWPPIDRVPRPVPDGAAALTVTPAWGVSAAPSRPGPYGRGGPWAEEVQDIEHAYGVERVVHLSLEEFARTLSNARENRERLREGGVPSRELSSRLLRAERSGDVERFRSAFRRFRAFDRKNVLHLFATFRVDRGFAREFPEAVQTGPLWPGRFRPPRSRERRRARAEWVWYASPSSAERIAPNVAAGLAEAAPGSRLRIVTPRPWTVGLPRANVEVVSNPLAPAQWESAFSQADVRIVTGSRTLLEAMELGGPFLYFNGVLGHGPRTRRHRPEKLTALLELADRNGVGTSVRADLGDFGSGRRVREVVTRVARRSEGWSQFPRRWSVGPFPPGFEDAGALIVRVARALRRTGTDASEIVARVRSGRAP